MAKKSLNSLKYSHKNISWEIFPELCKSCGLCIQKCPVKCLSYDRENNEYLGMPVVKCDAEKCIACRTCEAICPDCAIKVENNK